MEPCGDHGQQGQELSLREEEEQHNDYQMEEDELKRVPTYETDDSSGCYCQEDADDQEDAHHHDDDDDDDDEKENAPPTPISTISSNLPLHTPTPTRGRALHTTNNDRREQQEEEDHSPEPPLPICWGWYNILPSLTASPRTPSIIEDAPPPLPPPSSSSSLQKQGEYLTSPCGVETCNSFSSYMSSSPSLLYPPPINKVDKNYSSQEKQQVAAHPR
eukprot:7294504-Ditylum_brightwellii.AAC.1